MKFSERLEEIAKAIADAQLEIHNPYKKADNPYFKSKYAPLEAVIEAVKPSLAKHGVNIIQNVSTTEDGIVGISNLLIHSSGQYIETDTMYFKPIKNDVQSLGSTITYARRYSLCAVMNVCGDDDDDGNQASGNVEKKKDKATVKQLETIKGKTNEEQRQAILQKHNLTKLDELDRELATKLINQLQERENKAKIEALKQIDESKLPF